MKNRAGSSNPADRLLGVEPASLTRMAHSKSRIKVVSSIIAIYTDIYSISAIK